MYPYKIRNENMINSMEALFKTLVCRVGRKAFLEGLRDIKPSLEG